MKTLNENQNNRDKVLQNKPPRRKCSSCQYRANDRARGCDYMYLTGKRRGCSILECTAYVKGKRLSKPNEPAWSTKGL